MSDSSDSMYERMLQARIEDEEKVGRGLERLLLSLPGAPGIIEESMRGVQGASMHEQEHLSMSASAQAAPALSRYLVHYGLTPVDLFNAYQFVGDLIERLREAEVLPKEDPVELTKHAAFTFYLKREICQVARCSIAVAEACIRLLITALGVSPLFLPQLKAIPIKGGIALERCSENAQSWEERFRE